MNPQSQIMLGMKQHYVPFSYFVAVALLLSSCSNPGGDLKKAEEANTEEAYQAFIHKHPGSLLLAQAMADLADLVAWNRTKSTNNLQAFQGYLSDFPHGAHREDARNSIDAIFSTAPTTDLSGKARTYFASSLNSAAYRIITTQTGEKKTIACRQSFQDEGYSLSEANGKIQAHNVLLQFYSGWPFLLENIRVDNEKMLKTPTTISIASVNSHIIIPDPKSAVPVSVDQELKFDPWVTAIGATWNFMTNGMQLRTAAAVYTATNAGATIAFTRYGVAMKGIKIERLNSTNSAPAGILTL